MLLCPRNRVGVPPTKQDFGRVYLILPQSKAKICPIIVTMPIALRHRLFLLSVVVDFIDMVFFPIFDVLSLFPSCSLVVYSILGALRT